MVAEVSMVKVIAFVFSGASASVADAAVIVVL